MSKQKDAILKNQKQMLYKRNCNKIVDLLKSQKKLIIKIIFKKTGKTLEPYGVVSRKAVKKFLHHLSQ